MCTCTLPDWKENKSLLCLQVCLYFKYVVDVETAVGGTWTGPLLQITPTALEVLGICSVWYRVREMAPRGFLLVFAALLSLSSGHIHSQKVRGLDRSELGVSTWASALFSSALVGACGIFPLVLNKWVRLDEGCKRSLTFKAILSFAVGGLLGDVFLHLLPEAYGASSQTSFRGSDGSAHLTGLWVVIGVISFLAVEKLLLLTEGDKEEVEFVNGALTESTSSMNVTEVGKIDSQNGLTNGTVRGCVWPPGNTNSNCNAELFTTQNGSLARRVLHPTESHSEFPRYHAKPRFSPPSLYSRLWHWLGLSHLSSSTWLHKEASGYLNLVANCTDNFTHGLAIAAGYIVSPTVGALTTLAILCHEVPHEIGDFAILLNSGFSLKEAAKAQVVTASGGFVGVVVGLAAEQVASASSWLLPFTAGGFLYISLVSILPSLLEEAADNSVGETRLWWPALEVAAVGLGIVVMALVTIVEKKSCGHMPAHFIGGT